MIKRHSEKDFDNSVYKRVQPMDSVLGRDPGVESVPLDMTSLGSKKPDMGKKKSRRPKKKAKPIKSEGQQSLTPNDTSLMSFPDVAPSPRPLNMIDTGSIGPLPQSAGRFSTQDGMPYPAYGGLQEGEKKNLNMGMGFDAMSALPQAAMMAGPPGFQTPELGAQMPNQLGGPTLDMEPSAGQWQMRVEPNPQLGSGAPSLQSGAFAGQPPQMSPRPLALPQGRIAPSVSPMQGPHMNPATAGRMQAANSRYAINPMASNVEDFALRRQQQLPKSWNAGPNVGSIQGSSGGTVFFEPNSAGDPGFTQVQYPYGHRTISSAPPQMAPRPMPLESQMQQPLSPQPDSSAAHNFNMLSDKEKLEFLKSLNVPAPQRPMSSDFHGGGSPSIPKPEWYR